MIRKVCPIVLRDQEAKRQFLAFEHPLAGRQLVKGTVEQKESDELAARRELEEESGISIDLRNLKRIGASARIVSGQEWIFFETTLLNPPDHWTYRSNDDGGQLFSFFWQDIDAPLDDRWHESFHAVLDFYKVHQTVA